MSDNLPAVARDFSTVDKYTEGIVQIFDSVRNHHNTVSKIATPEAEVSQKANMDYVKFQYMKRMADKHYPDWNWEIINSFALGDAAYVVHGRLSWHEPSGLKRTCDAVAAHRIQRLQGTTDFVDVGNDVKAANSDAMKKAFSMGMNIADDVYRLLDPELDDAKVIELLTKAKLLGKEERFQHLINKGELNSYNFEDAIGKLDRLIKDRNNEDASTG